MLTAVVSAATMWVVLGAVAVASIRSDDGPYASPLLAEAGLRRGLTVAILLVAVLLAALTAQCSRIGGPERDRRWASYRLAGATPTDVVRLGAVEVAISSLMGSVAGTASFLLSRRAIDGLATVEGRYVIERRVSDDTVIFERAHGLVHVLPTDVHLLPWVLLFAALAWPVTAAAVSGLVLRRVRISPFGVVRRAGSRPARVLPAVLFTVGALTLVAVDPLRSAVGATDASRPLVVLIVVAGIAMATGLVGGVATIGRVVGGILAESTGSASVLLGARRLWCHPYAASRTNGVLVLVALIGGFTEGVRAFVLTTTSNAENPFYATTLNLVSVLLAVCVALAALAVLINVGQVVVTARRTFSALVATGVPRRVLQKSLLCEQAVPLVAAVPAAVLAGVFAARGVFGTSKTRSLGTVAHERLVTVHVPVPWVEMLMLVAGVIVAACLMAAVAVAIVDDATDPKELRTTA